MSIPLLSTKLDMPLSRPNLVMHSGLAARLNDGLHSKLTLISAPAGYGKTTLVTQWLQSAQVQTAWLSLDESDNDPIRFLAYIVAALQRIQAGLGEGVKAMIASPQPPPIEVTMTALINEIAAISQPFILVLDDYHAIHTTAIHQQIAFLLDHQPAQMHLVITTREDPLLPVARLRARGQVQEVRQDDLRFTEGEIADFLTNVMGLALSADDIAALERRTEGWIAGLQLAAVSMQGRDDLHNFIEAFAGSSRYVLDYLIEEVFGRQSGEVQDFLVKTSILDHLTGPLCDAVAKRTGSQELLAELEQANLFIVPLDQSRQWYRYHRLFAELLQHRLRMGIDVSEAVLHQRASLWHEQNDLLPEAIHHVLAAEDWSRAAVLLERVSDSMLKRGEVVTLVEWYGRIPEDVLLADPRLCFDACWPLLLVGQFEAAGPLLDHAERCAEGVPEFLGQVLAAQAYRARGLGDHPRMVRESRRALDLLPKTALETRGIVAMNLGIAYWHMGQMREAEEVLAEALEANRALDNPYAAVTSLIFQGMAMAVRGQLRQAAEVFEQAIQQGGQMPINALARMHLAALHYEWNNLDGCREHLQQAIELSRRGANDEFLVGCWLLQVRLELARQNTQGVNETLEQAEEYIRAGRIPEQMASRVRAMQAQAALAQDDLAAAGQSALADTVDAHPFYRFLGMARAQLLIAQGDSEAAAYLAGLYESAQQGDWIYGQIAVRVLQALAARSPETALGFLTDAFALGQSEGFIRTFADAGEALVPLLQEVALQGTSPDYVGEILAAIGEKPKTSMPSPLLDPLSEREIEVLRLVAAGLSNREIAKKLVISLGTAKTHIHNLCGKLGVRNRTEAAMRAKELGLI
ncbi:MAG: tetratricopeptide repeat protein [Anaerolineae bacterium]|nr:tetratricopeptide repeat protein [Anaerolineae bacterium]